VKQIEAPRRRRTGILRTVASWFDQTIPNEGLSDELHEKKVEWVRCIPFFSLHLFAACIIFVGWSWPAVLTCIALYFLRMFAITGFYHRYFSHRSFKTNRFWQFIFAVWGGTAAQRGALWWAAHHRHHHRHSDKEPDVHSPIIHEFLWSHMLWITSKANFETKDQEIKDLMKYPELRYLNDNDNLVPLLFGLAVFGWGYVAAWLWPESGVGPFQMLIWGFFVSTVLLFHGTCTINSLSHLFGTRRYETTDHSRNNFLLALVTMGEGWHNNHHYYPASTRQGFYWWEIDMTYYGLKMLSWLGIIRDLKPVPAHVRDGIGRGTPQDAH
jgi:stearoyl-CoA desaturase (delta-9 desaturase)